MNLQNKSYIRLMPFWGHIKPLFPFETILTVPQNLHVGIVEAYTFTLSVPSRGKGFVTNVVLRGKLLITATSVIRKM